MKRPGSSIGWEAGCIALLLAASITNAALLLWGWPL